jgi:hypothetical protein
MKLLDKFKSIASALIVDGSTVQFWNDRWNGIVPAQLFPELLSFARNSGASFASSTNSPDLLQNFFLPLSRGK